ncbi:MAG: hypothetical protein AB7P37_19370 [Ramlibacter sp.]
MKSAIAQMLYASLFALLAASPAHALYRCGNAYQDKPCTNSEGDARTTPSAKPAASVAAPQPPAAPAGSAYAQVCARLGQEAQKVAWKREAGATQDKQLAELARTGSRDEMAMVIASVYSRRGSAPEIRAAVEAECRAERQHEADKAAALAALQPRASRPVQTLAVPAEQARETDMPRTMSASQRTVDPKAACPGLRSMDATLREQMRAGGSAATMESLNAQRRRLDQRLFDAKC